MPIIVDGYNVLHASRWLPSSWKGADRDQLCRLLSQLARHNGEKITVVFDALPSKTALAPKTINQLEVIFSGHERTADDVIIQMIQASSGPRDLTVVSSDREIKTAREQIDLAQRLAQRLHQRFHIERSDFFGYYQQPRHVRSPKVGGAVFQWFSIRRA